MLRFAETQVPLRFWQLIDSAKSDAETIHTILRSLDQDDLIRFESHFEWSLSDLLDQVIPDRGDAYTEEEIAGWIISRGSAFYAHIFDNPEEFPSEESHDSPNFIGMAGVILDEQFPGWSREARIEFWPTALGSVILNTES